MSAAPTRLTDVSNISSRPSEAAAVEDERFRALEQKLLDASAQRVHDFERRLEHEWLALRQLHEEPLKHLENRSTAIAERCLEVVGEALALLQREREHATERDHRATAPDRELEVDVDPSQQVAPQPHHSNRALIALAIGSALVAAFAVESRWALGSEFRALESRAVAADARVVQLQQLVERESRENRETVQRLTAEALSSATHAERLANVLAASDVRAYPLRGQRAAAAADGQVFFSASQGIALTASRLPPASSNQIYQVWMMTTRGPVSLGFAPADGQGRVTSSFEVPPDLSGTVVGFMVTVEPTGGNAKPTGPIVLAS
jgi:hypothetical protein